MSRTDAHDPRARSRAYDCVTVEYQTVRREPRAVFDDLTRTSFEACAALADAVFDECTEHASPAEAARGGRLLAQEDSHVRCILEPEGPGRYLLGFEVPCGPGPGQGLSRLLHALGLKGAAARTDPALQGRLLSTTHLIEDLVLGVDSICSTAPGRLTVGIAGSEQDASIEFIDGVRILRRIHPRTWRLLHRDDVQDLLRRILAPFQDPELYTLNIRSQPPYGSLGRNWTVTSNEQLRRFAGGGRLDLPALGTPQDLLAS